MTTSLHNSFLRSFTSPLRSPFFFPKRFYPSTTNSFLLTEKLARRILYPFYNKEMYTKLYLPPQQTIIASMQIWAKHSENQQAFLKTLKNVWQNSALSNTASNPSLYNYEDLSHFCTAIKFQKPYIVKNVSGIWQPSQTFMDDENFMCELLLKTAFNLFYGPDIEVSKTLLINIGKTFCPTSFLNNPHFYPALQHTLNSMLTLHNFQTKDVAEINNNLINYTAYLTKTNVQVVIESYVFKYTLSSLIDLSKLERNYVAQNPDNPAGDHIKYSSLCYNQMKQPHGDIRADSLNVNISPKFFDSKLIGDPLNKLALSRGYLSLTSCFDNTHKLSLMKRSVGDYGGTIEQRLKNKQISQFQYNLAKTKILDMKLILSAKHLSLEDKFNNFTYMLHRINLDSNMPLVCSYIAQPPTDIDYELFYKTYLENKYDKAAIINALQLHKYALFPAQGQYVDRVAWHKMITVVINSLPEDVKAIVKMNYERVQSLETWQH